MTQNQALIKYLKTHKKGITQMEAFTRLGICRLSERIRELEARGYIIFRYKESSTNQHGNPTRFVRYKYSGIICLRDYR